MRKDDFVHQIMVQLQSTLAKARTASGAAQEMAEGAASGRASRQQANIASGHAKRVQDTLSDIAALDGFRPSAGPAVAKVGSIVEVEDEDSGEGRTFFVAPVGAGITLTGPEGDGEIAVVTPASPIGRALLGKRIDDIADITVRGEPVELRLTYIA